MGLMEDALSTAGISSLPLRNTASPPPSDVIPFGSDDADTKDVDETDTLGNDGCRFRCWPQLH